MGGRGKYKSLTLEQKIKVLIEVDKGEKKKKEIAKEYGIRPNTLSTYIQNKMRILESWKTKENCTRKRLREGDHPLVDACVKQWLTEVYDQNVVLNGAVIRSKAESFGKQMGLEDFKASSGWLAGFKERNGITLLNKLKCNNSSLDETLIRDWRMFLSRSLLDYDARNIYWADEVGLYYQCSPEETFFHKENKCVNGEQSDARFTVLTSSNMDGSDKLPILLVGNTSMEVLGVRSLPLQYVTNSESWMTRDIFVKWITNLDSIMIQLNRRALLFLNSRSVHSDLPKLTAISVMYLPSNLPPMLKPFDRITNEFKRSYRQLVLRILMENSVCGPASVSPLQGIRNVYKAWKSVDRRTVVDAFERAQFQKCVTSDSTNSSVNSEDPVNTHTWWNSDCLVRRLMEYCPLIDVVEPPEWKEYTSKSCTYSSFKLFVDVDKGLSVCREFSDEKCQTINCGGEGASNATPVTCTNTLNHNDMKSVLNSLRTCIESQSNVTHHIFDALDTIDDFLYTLKKS